MSGPENNSKVEYYAALLALDVTTSKVRRIDMWDDNSEAERRNFYESVLRISWLSPEVRRAIFKVLNRSYRAYKAEINDAVAATLRVLIAEEEARLRKDRQ